MPLTSPQKQVTQSKARNRVLITGRRFGKTFIAIGELLNFACKKPKQKVWYVAPTYRQAKQICWAKLKEVAIDNDLVSYINETDLTLRLHNNSEISLRGSDRSYDQLRGVGLNFLVLDEFADIPSEAYYSVLRATLSDTKGDFFACGTPRGYGNWAYDLYMKGKEDKDWESWQFTTLQGEQVDSDEVEAAKADLDERTFRQEYEATFETYSGAIYYNFNREDNVKTVKDNNTTLHIGMDFNIDPMSAAVFQIENNVINFIDEIIIYSSNTEELVKEIQTRYPERKIIVYPDPACRQRKTSAGGRTDLTILQNAGLTVRVKNAHPQIRDRINAVNSRLKNTNEQRMLFINPKCKNIIRGLERHLYKEGTTQPDKDSGFDHMNDALGYAVDYLFPIRKNYNKELPTRWSVK
jgi:hypothetical protein